MVQREGQLIVCLMMVTVVVVVVVVVINWMVWIGLSRVSWTFVGRPSVPTR